MSFEPNRFDPPKKYKTMDDLYAQALNYADWCLRESTPGMTYPALFILSADGPPAYMVWSHEFGDEATKEEFTKTCRIFCAAHAATHALIVVEGWALFQTSHTLTVMPRESPDRVECVNFITETRNQPCGLRVRPIIRTANQKYFGLGDEIGSPGRMADSRFYPLLMSEQPEIPLRLAAKVVLESMGFHPVGFAPKSS